MKLIKDIRKKNGCDFNYRCLTLDIIKICPVEDIRIDGYVDVINNSVSCQYKIPFGYGFLCKCPARIYIARHLEINTK